MEKRLYKSSSDKVLAGVCGDIGDYFDVDPVLIRVLWVVSAFFGGVGVLAYIIAAIIMPEQDLRTNPKTVRDKTAAGQTQGQTQRQAQGQYQYQPRPQTPKTSYAGKDPAPLAGVILVAVGGFFLLREFMPWVSGGIVAAVFFIAVGAFLLVPGSGGSR